MDFIESAILNAKNDGATADTQWSVLFKHGEARSGIITPLHPGYRLERNSKEKALYFSPDSVIYLIPQIPK